MKTIITLIVFVFSNFLFSQVSEFDSSFGTSGVVLDNTINDAFPKSIFYENNKYILVSNYAVHSRNYDGSKNVAFGNNGSRSFYSSTETFITVGGKIQNGFIYIFGYVYNNSTSDNYNFYLAKMSTLGVFDNTFGNNGFMKFDLGSNNEIVNDILINPNGEIYAVGTKEAAIFMAKINLNGTLDTSFNTTGYKTFNFSLNESTSGINIYNYQGQYLIIGNSLNSPFMSLYDKHLLIMHVDSNGNFINTFGTNGLIYKNLISNGDTGTYEVINSKLISNNLYVSYSYFFSFLTQYKNLVKYDLSTNVLNNNSCGLQFTNFDYIIDSNENVFGTGSARCNFSPCSRKFKISKQNFSNIFNYTEYSYEFTTDSFSDSRSSVIYQHDDGKLVVAGNTYHPFNASSRGFAMIRFTDFPLSNNQFNTNEVFVISPNPANQELNIDSKQGVIITKIEIIDANGRLISSQNKDFQKVIIENLQQGLYFVKIKTEDTESVLKFIKK